MHSKFPKEVDDSFAAIWKAEPQYEWSENDTQNFLDEDDDFHLVEGGEILSDLVAVKSTLPVSWQIMCIINHVIQGIFRVENKVVFWNDSPSNCPYSTEHTKVK